MYGNKRDKKFYMYMFVEVTFTSKQRARLNKHHLSEGRGRKLQKYFRNCNKELCSALKL